MYLQEITTINACQQQMCQFVSVFVLMLSVSVVRLPLRASEYRQKIDDNGPVSVQCVFGQLRSQSEWAKLHSGWQ